MKDDKLQALSEIPEYAKTTKKEKRNQQLALYMQFWKFW